jgi:ferrochelatase
MAELAVLLMDYGAPGTDAEVRPFIASLLSDPAVLPLPIGIRQALAHGIALRRAPEVVQRYRAIGGSPLPAAVDALASDLGTRLRRLAVVRPAYCHAAPRIAAVVSELAGAGVRRVLGVPLFPQRSWTTSDVCQRLLQDASSKHGLDAAVAPDFATEPGLLEAMAAGLLPLIEPGSHVVMVAHGLPERLDRAGDPYAGRVRESARALAERMPPDTPWSLAFQSRLGPTAWTGPYLEDELERLAEEGVRDLVLQPLSFATENLETRWDLDHVARARARELGVERVARAPAPGSQDAFVDMIEAHARRALSSSGWCPSGGEE